MIKYKSITIRNFLSYGDVPVTFNFENGLSRIIGKNGDGKSTTVIEGLWYNLFGEAYRSINLSQLINNINKKDLQTTSYFDINDTQYKVARGIKPNYFRVYKKNDSSREFEETDIVSVPSSTRSYQQILQEDILHKDSNIAEQILIKSLTKDMSFLKLKKPAKREIIENILDIRVFTSMNKVTKDKVDNMTKSLVLDNKDLEHVTSSITTEKDNLTRLKLINEGIEKDLVEKKKTTQEEIVGLQIKNDLMYKAIYDIEPWKASKTKLQTEVATLNEKISDTKLKLRQEINTIEEEFREKRIAVDIKISESGLTLKGDKFAINAEIAEHNLLITDCKVHSQEVILELRNKIQSYHNLTQDYKLQIATLNISNAEIQVKIDFMTKTCTDCPKAKELMSDDVTDGIGKNNKLIKKLEKAIQQEMDRISATEKDIALAEELNKADIEKINNNIQRCNDDIKTLEEDYTRQINFLNKQKEELIAECRKEELLITERYDNMDLDTVKRIAELNEEIRECDNKMKAIVDEVSK